MGPGLADPVSVNNRQVATGVLFWNPLELKLVAMRWDLGVRVLLEPAIPANGFLRCLLDMSAGQHVSFAGSSSKLPCPAQNLNSHLLVVFSSSWGNGGVGATTKMNFPPQIVINHLLLVSIRLWKAALVLTASQTHCPPQILNSHLLPISTGNWKNAQLKVAKPRLISCR